MDSASFFSTTRRCYDKGRERDAGCKGSYQVRCSLKRSSSFRLLDYKSGRSNQLFRIIHQHAHFTNARKNTKLIWIRRSAILPNLLAKRRKLLDGRDEELKKAFEKLEKEKKSLGCGNDSDVIHLNVGGTLMATLRSTLTYLDDSMLAARFSGRWDESIAKDKDGNFFIDPPIELFLLMINFIRNKQGETLLEGAPSSPSLETFNDDDLKYGDFKRMVEYFGMTPGIYPVELVDYSMASKERLAVSGASSTLKLAFDERKVCVLFPSKHFRQIIGFEVKIGDSVNLQVGWAKSPIVGNTDVCSNVQSIVLDLARGGISCQGSLVSVSNTIQNGTFVRCKNFGKEWFIDGEKIVGPWEKTWTLQGVVPVISGKGEWAITAVELGP